MTTLDKIIERYRINDSDDGLGSIMWGGKLFYKKNDNTPILLSRVPGGFRLSDDNKCYELDNDYYPTEGETLDKYYPHPFFENKILKGFKVIRPIPNFKQNIVYLIQSGVDNMDFISGGKFQCVYHVNDCLDFPEIFEPVYK